MQGKVGPKMPYINLFSQTDVPELTDHKILKGERRGGFWPVSDMWIPRKVINSQWDPDESCSQG